MRHLFNATSSFVRHFITIGKFEMELQSKNTQFGSKSPICELCDLEIWQITLKINRAHFLCYLNVSASFPSHLWIQKGITVRKCRIWVKIGDFFCLVWPWNLTMTLKTIGHLFDASSSFVYHFNPIGKFKLELQPGNAQFGSKSTIVSCVTLWFNRWPWKKKKNMAPLPNNIKLCASFHRHMWTQTGVAVRKHLSKVLTFVTLTFHL